ncbi:hypothetical protein B5X24_HaOG207140 [Helicoverpa armigera]|uniref:Reverse transcriptase domain-containing protein n=1 Tax=Helicoverpa armigera TaxID=29058 RepID=A0A2W1BNH4_HELAM|nr:hypothetical protein B5X24_HaOG207140 [Helicoverpa armigera]
MKMSTVRNELSGVPADPRRHWVPGPSGVKWTTEASGVVDHQATFRGNVTGGQRKLLNLCQQYLVATWNVRGLLKTGKLNIVEKEMRQYNISILGLGETHMRGAGHFNTDDGSTMYFSGAVGESINGVGFIVPPTINKYVTGYNTVSDRIITLRLNAKPMPLNIVQIYAPTAQSSPESIDEFYATLEATITAIPKREMLVIMGDWNAKIGDTSADDHMRNVVGKYGLGVRNQRGERLLDFCITRELAVHNTRFKHHVRRLYTWVSPGDRCRNQIDYIMTSSRWNSSIQNVKTYPGADCGSDHNLLVAWMKLRLKRASKSKSRLCRKIDLTEAKTFRDQVDLKLKGREDTINTVTTTWNSLKSSITDTLREMTRAGTRQPKRKIFIQDETWEAIEKRKDLKTIGLNKDDDEYKQRDREVQKLCRRDKNRHLTNICREIQAHADRLQPGELFKKVRYLTRSFKPKTWVVEDEHGSAISELNEVAERWRQYCQDLYQDVTTSVQAHSQPCSSEQEPPILFEELVQAIKTTKDGKAPGIDQITAEIIKALGEEALKLLHELCNKIWSTGEWPLDWTRSVILPLHKKGSTKVCDNYRTISLIPHVSKILLHILNKRVRYYLDPEIPQEQAGFVKGKGTREQILNVRQIIESSHEFDSPVILCFVDYKKAFDCVVWEKLWQVLSEMGVPLHLTTLIRKLYEGSRGSVRIKECMSDEFRFQKGVRQGCILSPILFNIYGEYILRKALEGWEGGVNIGGVRVANLRYADDTTLLAESAGEMEELLRRVENISSDLGLSINRSKTKVMVVDRFGKLDLSNALSNFEKVQEFNYLGSVITSNASSEQEIRRRIAMSKSAMTQLRKIWKDSNIRRQTKPSGIKGNVRLCGRCVG